MQREKFEHRNDAVEMAASSSKLLQIARKTNRTGNPPRKKNKTERIETIPDPMIFNRDIR
jgi:hypothetical protein